MADVTGPISTLPGARHALPDGAKCDEHPDRDAVARVQGETDSFGSELIDMCAECLAADKAYEIEAREEEGTCEWCKCTAKGLRNHRDYDEGLAGRVYRVCTDCIDRENAELERDEMFRCDIWDDDYDR